MNIVVVGATGFIGRNLAAGLLRSGCSLTVLGRDLSRLKSEFPSAVPVAWDALEGPPNPDVFVGVDAVVNLVGASVAAGRWNEGRKKKIYDSRILGTRHLVQAFEACSERPSVLVNASAIGFYGNRRDRELEETTDAGDGFLSELCRDWEREATTAERLGLRVVLLRTGIVLARQEGALAKMLLPFRLGLGGRFGDGRQWMSWIHLSDELGLIRHAIENDEVSGALNATSPQPVTNRSFVRELAAILHRPAWFPVPALALELLLGEMARTLLLGGQRVLPRKALKTGYRFQFPSLNEALRDLLLLKA